MGSVLISSWKDQPRMELNIKTPEDIFEFVTEGHEDSEKILIKIFKGLKRKTREVIKMFDDMNMRGKQIVYAYKYCGGDVDLLMKLLAKKDEKLILFVNKKAAESANQVYMAVENREKGSFPTFSKEELYYLLKLEEIKPIKSEPEQMGE